MMVALLTANLIAVGVPVLHALSHHDRPDHHHRLALGVSSDHGEHGQHPRLLHDDWTLSGRALGDLAFVAPTVPDAAEPHILTSAPRPPLTPTLQSRAPPSLDLARAPPSA